MENVWLVASVWVGLALLATLLAIWLKISTALSEIVVGTVAQFVIGVAIGTDALSAIFRAVSRRDDGRAVRARLVVVFELAGRCRTLDDICRGRLRGHAGTRIQ